MNFEVKYKIKMLRKKKGMTLRELEKNSGVSKSQLSNIERNETDPKLTTLIMIASALKVNITDIFDIITHK